MSSIQYYFAQIYRRPALWVAVVAAFCYSSWPLGLILNPVVGKHALASQLEAPGQPYNWVFIGLDVLTGIAMCVIGILQFGAYRKHIMFRLCIAGYIIFGILVALAAVLPLNCNPQSNSCGLLINDPVVIVHGLASILSVLFLLASVMVLGVASYRRQMSRLIRLAIGAILSCWLVFGLGSVAEIVWRINNNLMQDYFITICSVSLILVVASIEYLHHTSAHKPTA
jgi:hypothetical protein